MQRAVDDDAEPDRIEDAEHSGRERKRGAIKGEARRGAPGNTGERVDTTPECGDAPAHRASGRLRWAKPAACAVNIAA
jgi:hypothetical protein